VAYVGKNTEMRRERDSLAKFGAFERKIVYANDFVTKSPIPLPSQARPLFNMT